MTTRMFILVAALAVVPAVSAQSPHDWHYYDLPAGPTAPGVHKVVGHRRQAVPFYMPSSQPSQVGPRTHLRFGWFGRYTPSPRPRVPTVTVRTIDGT